MIKNKLIRNADADCGCGSSPASVIPSTSPVQVTESCNEPVYPVENNPECPIKLQPKCIPMGITNTKLGITSDMNLAQVMAIVLANTNKTQVVGLVLNIPVSVTVLRNDFGTVTFTPTLIGNGHIRITASSPIFTNGKSFIIGSSCKFFDILYFATGVRFSDTEFDIYLTLHDSTRTGTPSIENFYFEILVNP